jgi:hypothetical protein
MTKQEFAEAYGLHEDAILFGSDGEWDTYKEAIIGVHEDGKHVVYSYERLVGALSEAYGSTEDAVAWIDYNTIRAIPYMPQEYAPIIIYEVENL